MKKTKKALASLAIAGMVLSMAPMSVFAADSATDRIYGADRVQTAVEVAKKGWTTATTAIVAPAEDEHLVDALAAAPLAGAKNAPILLVEGKTLTTATTDELKALGVKDVYVVGAVDAGVVTQLTTAGYNATAVKGASRMDTAAEIAKLLSAPKGSFVVGYDAIPDALSVASYAAANNYQILVANVDGTLPSNEVVTGTTYVLGGPTLVKDVPAGAERVFGNDRYDTNKSILAKLSYSYDKVYVANGEDNHLVDSLVASGLAGQTKSPIALTDNMTVKAAADLSAKLGASSQTIALGGPSVVADTVRDSVKYAVPATLAVASVNAINASQLQVVFNKPVNKSSLVNTGVSPNVLVPTDIVISRLPSKAANNIDTTKLLASLSTDKKTLTLTASPADGVFFDGTYSIYIPANEITGNETGELLPAYSSTFTVSDSTAPTVASVVFNATSNKIDVKMSEPVSTAPTVRINNGSPLATPDISTSSSRTTYSYPNTWTLGTTVNVSVSGAIDANDNDMASVYTSSVTLTQNTDTPTVSAVSQNDSNVIKVAFSKAPNGTTDAAREATVASAISVLRAGTPITVASVKTDSTDSSKLTYKVTLNAAGAPDYDFYNGKTSTTLTVDVADGAYIDCYGIANDGEIVKTLVMTQDSSAPVISNIVLNSDKDGLVVFFNKSVSDASVDTSKISVRQDGIDVTSSFTFGTGAVADDQTVVLSYVGDIPSGNYTVRFDSGAITDSNGNEIDAVNKTITVDSTDSPVTVSVAPGAGTNEYVLTFSDAVGTSALQPSSYTLDGTALPTGTDIYFVDSTKKVVNMTLASGSVNFDDALATLRVVKVLDSNGSKVGATNLTVAVVDNVKPTLQSASVAGNIITLNFDEDMASSGLLTFTDLLRDFSIKGGTVDLAGTTGNLVTSIDGSKVVIVVSDAGDSNWNVVKAYSSLTIKTKDTSALVTQTLTDASGAAKIMKDGVSVSAPISR